MINNYLIRNKNILCNLITQISFFLSITIALANTFINLSETFGLTSNYAVMIRIILFLSFSFTFVIFNILNYRLPVRWSDLGPKIMALMTLTLMVNIVFLFYLNALKRFEWFFYLPVASIFLLLIWLSADSINSLIKRYINTLLIFSILAAVFAPLLVPKYLNSESFIDMKEIQYDLSKSKKDFSQKDLVIEVPQKYINTLERNIRFSEDTSASFIGIYSYKPSINGGATFTTRPNKSNLPVLCLLQDYADVRNKYPGQLDCVNYAKHISKQLRHKTDIDIFINGLIYFDEVVSSVVAGRANDFSTRNTSVMPDRKTIDHLEGMLVKGAVFHHYDYILSSIYSQKNKLNYFTNQYGFGPLFLLDRFATSFNFKIFDALYLLIPVINLMFLIMLYFALKKDENANLIYFCFVLSVFSVFAVSNVLAPMLYFIRYLPSLILAVFLYKKIGGSEGYHFRDRLLVAALLLLASINNFEYGVITAFAFLFVGLRFKDKFYTGISIVSLIVSLSTKLILPVSTNGLSQHDSYLSMLFGVGQDGSLGFGVFILLFFVGYLILVSTYFNRKEMNKELWVLLSFLIFFFVKSIWTGSLNHAGPYFMILGLFLSGMLKVIPEIKKQMIKSFSLFSFILVVFITSCFVNQKYQTDRYAGVVYVTSSMSDLFKVSSADKMKLNQFNSMFELGDFALSQNDHMLALGSNSRVTGKYTSISTSLNSNLDVITVSHYFADSNRHIIVDKSILLNDSYNELATNFYGFSKELDAFISGFHVERMKFKEIYFYLLGNGWYGCDENENFIKLCRVTNDQKNKS